ncbi:MAG: aromatic ring-hydroxylating dioxygenase subunit alpha [Aquabacterium sp.]|nr:MAG: aromatic ring-hydroxylating dioxygenase subunit alpha [Aquabacterium sp.]
MSAPSATHLHPDVQAVLSNLDPATRDLPDARVLPPQAYCSDAFFEFEREAVFMHSWLCVGRVEQLPAAGDYIALTVAGESILVVRDTGGGVRAMSALCRHRGHPVAQNCSGNAKRFTCPYHRWTYDLEGRLVGAPHIVRQVPIETLKQEATLPPVRCEVWQGFVFVNFDDGAPALAPTLSKLDPYFEGYPMHDMVAVLPRPQEAPVPWNWKILLENYIEPYHTEFVHPVIHDFAPSTGVVFDPWHPDDNAISRGVPFLAEGGGLTEAGWAAPASFPVIPTLSDRQKRQVAFCLLPPTMNLIFTPDMICWGVTYPESATSLRVSGGLFTHGGWLVPRATAELPDFDDRAARLMEGSRQLGEQDTGVNVAMQAAKRSRHAPHGRLCYLEETLSQFNKWLSAKYRAQAARSGLG